MMSSICLAITTVSFGVAANAEGVARATDMATAIAKDLLLIIIFPPSYFFWAIDRACSPMRDCKVQPLCDRSLGCRREFVGDVIECEQQPIHERFELRLLDNERWADRHGVADGPQHQATRCCCVDHILCGIEFSGKSRFDFLSATISMPQIRPRPLTSPT